MTRFVASICTSPRIKGWYFLSFAALLAFNGMIYLEANELFLDGYFLIPDAMYLPSMYDDLVLNNNAIEGWNLNPAPNFFPDIPLYFGLQWLLGDFKNAIAAFSLVQMAVTSLLFKALFTTVTKHAYTIATVANLMLLLFPLMHFLDAEYIFSMQPIINSFHHSAFVNGLVGVIFFFSFLKTKNRWWLFGILSYSIISIISDKLYVVSFILPALLISLLALPKLKREGFYLLLTILLSGFLGLLIFDQLKSMTIITIPNPHKYLEFDNITSSLQQLWQQWTEYASLFRITGWVLSFTLLSTLFAWYCLIKRLFVAKRAKNWEVLSESAYFEAFVAVYIPIVLFAPVLSGSYTGSDTIRYNYFAYMLGVAVLPYWILKTIGLSEKPWLPKISTASGFVSLLLCGVFYFVLDLNPYAEYHNFYPKRVEEIDGIAQEHDLKIGIGPYGQSKIITLFSKQNLKVYTVHTNLKPWFHVSNPKWYYHTDGAKKQQKIFDFVIPDDDFAIAKTNEILGPIVSHVRLKSFDLIKTQPFVFDSTSTLPRLLTE